MTEEKRNEETAKIRKGPNQKLKMLYLAGILSEETDDRHSLTIQDLIEGLAALGVNADRNASDYVRETVDIPADRVFNIHLAPGGGCALRLVRK